MTIPRKLAKIVKEQNGRYWKIAEACEGINVSYVYKYLKYGIEPINEEVRVKMFLPKRQRKPRQPKEPMPEWLKKVKRDIRRMIKENNESIHHSRMP